MAGSSRDSGTKERKLERDANRSRRFPLRIDEVSLETREISGEEDGLSEEIEEPLE